MNNKGLLSILNKIKIVTQEEQINQQHRTVYEPIRTNRFLVEFINGFSIDNRFIINVTGPTWTNDNGWEDIIISFTDAITPPIRQYVFDYMNNPNIDNQTHEFNICLLDSAGVAVSKWNILSNGIDTLNYGDFSYSDDTVHTIRIRFKVNNCVLIY